MHIVIVPIYKTEQDLLEITDYLEPYIREIEEQGLQIKSQFLGDLDLPINIQVDTDDQKSPGWKYNEYELKGVPIRIAIGKRDIESQQVEVYRRDTQNKELVSSRKLVQHVL